MAMEIIETKVATFELTLQNNNDSSDTKKRSISFDLPNNSTIGAANLQTIASTYFAVAGMSNVFQPTDWRDAKGEDDVYILQSVTPVLTEKIVTKADTVNMPE